MNGQLNAFETSGSSPTGRRRRLPLGPVNYKIEKVSFLVFREGGGATTRPVLSQPSAVHEVAHELIPDDAREHFLTLCLDSQNRLVASHEVSVGTLSASLVHPREVFGPALRLLGVAALILVHNHPSGDPTASREDIRLTRQLVDAGRLLDIRVHDHVVIGNGSARWVSFAEQGLIGQ